MKRFFGIICLTAAISFIAPILYAKEKAAMITADKKVKFDYTLTVDGQEVENSKENGPVEYVHGAGNIIPGLEKQMEGMKVGQTKAIKVNPEEGYGTINPKAFQEVPKSNIPSDVPLEVGKFLKVTDPNGRNFSALITEIREGSVILNFNHPLAGKDLLFKVTIVSIQ